LREDADGEGARAIAVSDRLLRLDQDQAAKLRAMAAARVNSKLDLENLAEEVESLGRSDLNAVRSQVRRIVEHLLKLEFSPSIPPRDDWRHSVAQARDELADLLTPALRREVEDDVATTFDRRPAPRAPCLHQRQMLARGNDGHGRSKHAAQADGQLILDACSIATRSTRSKTTSCLVAGCSPSRRACSSARVSACSTGMPAAVKRLTEA
jgi:hypothetical protein